MQRNNIQLTMLILFAISLLPFKMCQIQQQFRNESSSPLPIPLPLANSPSTIRLKRQYSLPSGQSACGGCPSKFTPVNCKCTSTPNDELICRCDRAILANLREEPDRPQCPCRRGIGAAGDLNNFRGEISELTSRVQNLGPINSACHPICHQSCLNSCTRPVGREIDSYRDRYGPMATNNDVPNHQQSSPLSSSPSIQHQYPFEQVPGCQPSLCRTNCLRACSRILDGQKGGGDFGDPRGPSTDTYQENLGGIEPPTPTHYEVRPADPYLGKMPSPPEYPQLMGKNEGTTLGNNGGNCQCSPGAFCDCPETCFPICFDSCDANCNSNNQAQSQTQRRICAQSCHYECQKNCAEKQRQKQQQLGGNELGINNNNPTNNVVGVWTAGTQTPPQIADNNDSDGKFQQGNNAITNNQQQAIMPTNCLAKCPKSCETACSMANEDPKNCAPACVSICAQSCARGLNQFDANSGQSPQIPDFQFQTQQQQFQQNIEGNLQQQQTQLRQQLMEGLERSKMQQQTSMMPTMQMPIMNGGGGGIFPFEMNLFKNGTGMQEGINGQQQMGKGQLPQTMFLNDGLGNNAAKGMTFSQPCAPLCQPACTPECNRRYMEERKGQQRLYRGIGGQFGTANPQQRTAINGGGNEQTATFNGQMNNFGENSITVHESADQFESSKPGQIFPPHYILPMADDLDLANGTVDDFLVEGEKQIDDDLELEALLRPQNETGNSTQILGKKEGTKIREEKQRTVKPETTLALAKPWKGEKAGKNGGRQMEEFFKRRMGKLMKVGNKKMKGEQITAAGSG